MWMTQKFVPGPRIEMVLSILAPGHARDCEPWMGEELPRKADRISGPSVLVLAGAQYNGGSTNKRVAGHSMSCHER